MNQILKGARRNAGAAHEAGPACLDAETLAAWADDGVDADRAREIEMHVASCTRCQEMSAAFFRTQDAAAAPAAAATVIPFKRNRLMYWLPIAAGVAATLVVWLNLPQRETPAPDLTMSKVAPAEAPAPAPEAGAFRKAEGQQGQSATGADSRAASRQLAEPKSVQRLDQITSAELRKERVAKPPAPAAVKPDAAPIQPAAGRVGGVAGGVGNGIAVATPPPPPAIATAPPVLIPPAQNAAAASARESFAFRSAVEPTVIAEFSSDDLRLSLSLSRVAGGAAAAGGGGGRGGGGGGGAGRGGRGGAPTVVADASKAEGVAYWRILAAGVVEKSPDHAVWTPILIDPPPQGLAAGAAPLPNVCWLAGKGGLVLLSTDGRTFTRVAAPTSADLVAVAASSALQASVRTVDGRTFITTDGGKTWREPGLKPRPT